MKRYQFPMTRGIMTADGRSFLGLAFRDADAAFVLYDIDADEILKPLVFMDATNWKQFSYEDGYPAGISDTGALFISRYIMKTRGNKERIDGMKLEVYDLSGNQKASFSVSDGVDDWVSDHRLLTAAVVGEDRYLYVVQDEKAIFVNLYDDAIGQTFPVLGHAEDDVEYRDVRFDPATRILEAKIFPELESPAEFDICRWEIAENYLSGRKLHRQHICLMQGDEFPEGTLTVKKEKLGFLKGSNVTFCDAATGEELYSGTDNLKADFVYLPLLALDTILIRKSALMKNKDEICVLHRENGSFRRIDLLPVSDDATVTWNEEQGWICICGDYTTVYRC